MILLQKEMKLEYSKTYILIIYNLNVQQIIDNLSQKFSLKGKPNDIHAQNVLYTNYPWKSKQSLRQYKIRWKEHFMNAPLDGLESNTIYNTTVVTTGALR